MRTAVGGAASRASGDGAPTRKTDQRSASGSSSSELLKASLVMIVKATGTPCVASAPALCVESVLLPSGTAAATSSVVVGVETSAPPSDTDAAYAPRTVGV